MILFCLSFTAGLGFALCTGEHTSGDSLLLRTVRQSYSPYDSYSSYSPAASYGPSYYPPVYQPPPQVDPCYTLTGQYAPNGCQFVPNLIDPRRNNALLNCRLDCDVQPLQFLGMFQPSNQIINQVMDQSNFDRFTGDSFNFFPSLTTTASPSPTPSTPTPGPVTTTVSTTSSSPSGPEPPPPPPPVPPPGLSNIEQCIIGRCAPPPGASFINTGTSQPTLTCAFLGACVNTPFTPDCAGLPLPADNVRQCLQLNGAPPAGCTYTGTGLLFPTLTCPILCQVENCVPTIN